MATLREDVDAGRVDFSDLVDPRGEPIGPIHPGAIRHEDWLEPLGLDAGRLAADLAVPPSRIVALLAGEGGITADIAMRLGRYLKTSPEFWMNLQVRYDLDVARRTPARCIEAEVKPRAA